MLLTYCTATSNSNVPHDSLIHSKPWEQEGGLTYNFYLFLAMIRHKLWTVNSFHAMAMNELNDHTSQLLRRKSFEDVFGNYHLKLFDAEPSSACTVHLSGKI